MMNKVLVIGGGAAGMMASIWAAGAGAEVTVIEPNERLGKKLNITGKGRCNVTNDASAEELLANVPRNGKFLYSSFARFDGRDAMAFFEGLGVPLKVERGNRVFPVSDRSFDVSAALERRMRGVHVSIVRDRAVSLLLADGAIQGVRGERKSYSADAVILATGGVSYPATGSTGDGFRMAAEAGHTVIEPVGSLVPLRAAGNTCSDLQGLSLRNVELRVFDIEEVDRNELSRVVDKLMHARHIYILGVRSSSFLAGYLNFYLHLLFENVTLVQSNAAGEIFEQLFRIGPGDAIIGISFPRYSKVALNTVKFAADRGAEVIAITDSEISPLYQLSNEALLVRSEMISFIDSMTAPLSLLNALIVDIGIRMNRDISKTFAELEGIWDAYSVFGKMDDE